MKNRSPLHDRAPLHLGRGSRRVVALVVLAAALLLGAATASASHYRLPIKDRRLVNDDELKALNAAGVATTLALNQRSARAADREELARRTGIPFARLTTLACQTDLLRVRGLGPSMMKLLQTAGVTHTRALRDASAADLEQLLKAANSVHQVASVLPRQEVLADWIAQARALPQTLELEGVP